MSFVTYFQQLHNRISELENTISSLQGEVNYLDSRLHITPLLKSKKKKIMDLFNLLEMGEEVIFGVRIEESVAAKCITIFDGEMLNVIECDSMPSLVGMSSSKPDEILYVFYDLLEKGGYIQYNTQVDIWKSCFVRRKGKLVSIGWLYKKWKKRQNVMT